MIRSGTINTIHEMSAQGKSIREIARIVGIARNTVRRYLRGKPIAAPRPKRGSILDPYKGQIRTWMTEDHLYNCEVMFPRLQAQGYTGGLSTIKAYVQTLRPAKVGQYPTFRCRFFKPNKKQDMLFCYDTKEVFTVSRRKEKHVVSRNSMALDERSVNAVSSVELAPGQRVGLLQLGNCAGQYVWLDPGG